MNTKSGNTRCSWGAGMFSDIPDIRRAVYTEYFVMTEHADTMKEILGAVPYDHCEKLLRKIDDTQFGIDDYNYEQIKAHLWDEAINEYKVEIIKWKNKRRESVIEASKELLRFSSQLFKDELEELSTQQAWKNAVLFSASLGLLDLLSTKDIISSATEMKTAVANENEANGIILGIDFFSDFFRKVVQVPQQVVVLPGEISSLATDLKIYCERLLDRWSKISIGKNGKFKVTILVNREICPHNNNKNIQRISSYDDVEDVIRLDGFEGLRGYREKGVFEICYFSSKIPGVVVSDFDETCLRIVSDADYVISLGEQNNLTLSTFWRDSFRVFFIRDHISSFFTGIKNNTEDHRFPKLCLLDVPATVSPAVDYHPDLKTKYNARQYFEANRFLPQEKWNALIADCKRSFGGDIQNTIFNSEILSEVEKMQLRRIFCNDSMEFFAKNLIQEFCGDYNRSAIVIGENKERVMHVVSYTPGRVNSRGESLVMDVHFANQVKNYKGIPKSRLTFDDTGTCTPSAVFAFNMLYFITRNILFKFNQSNNHFHLDESFFGEFIDFLKIKRGSEFTMYPSLYNKGAIGMNRDGSFEFGRIALPRNGNVSIPIGKRNVVFSWTEVNPSENLANCIAMFTPMERKFFDCQKRAQHFVGQTKAMSFLPENENYNFVFVNDILLGVVKGVTEIPPFGSVLSVPPAYLSASTKSDLDSMVTTSGEKKAVEKNTFVRFEFALDSHWDQCEWIMGGALLMVDDGKIENLIYDPSSGERTLYDIEGWSLETSQRTQETSVEANLNEARMSVGLTHSGQLFISAIEGRAKNRTGATHQETVEWLSAYFAQKGETIRYLLDLDSASSVSLGFFQDRRFHLLNQTARGSDSKMGDTRYYNHVAVLKVHSSSLAPS